MGNALCAEHQAVANDIVVEQAEKQPEVQPQVVEAPVEEPAEVEEPKEEEKPEENSEEKPEEKPEEEAPYAAFSGPSMILKDASVSVLASQVSSLKDDSPDRAKAKDALKDMVKEFWAETVKGFKTQIVEDGEVAPATFTLAQDKKSFTLASENKTTEIQFGEVEHMFRGIKAVKEHMPSLTDEQAEVSGGVTTKDKKTTIMVFKDAETASRFITCFKITARISAIQKGTPTPVNTPAAGQSAAAVEA